MRFAIYKGQTLHAILESPKGEKVDRFGYAESLRVMNGATSVVPIESDEHEKELTVDAATGTTIGEGFAFKGARLSLSVKSQTAICFAFNRRDALPYPMKWPTADGGAVVLEKAGDVAALYEAAADAVLGARTAGAEAKTAARVAVSAKSKAVRR